MDRASSLIAGALAKRGLGAHAYGSLALHRVNEWLRERFPASKQPAKAERIAEGVLLVACNHPAIQQELQAQLPELRLFLAKECPFAAITDIRVARAGSGAGNALAPGNPPA